MNKELIKEKNIVCCWTDTMKLEQLKCTKLAKYMHENKRPYCENHSMKADKINKKREEDWLNKYFEWNKVIIKKELNNNYCSNCGSPNRAKYEVIGKRDNKNNFIENLNRCEKCLIPTIDMMLNEISLPVEEWYKNLLKEANQKLIENINKYLNQMKPFSLKGSQEGNLVDEGYYQLITILQEKLNNGDFNE